MFLVAISVVWTLKVLNCSCITFVTPLRLAMELRPFLPFIYLFFNTYICTYTIITS